MSCSILWESQEYKTTQVQIEGPNNHYLPLLRTMGFHKVWGLVLGFARLPQKSCYGSLCPIQTYLLMLYMRYLHNLRFIWHVVSTDNFSFNKNTPMKVDIIFVQKYQYIFCVTIVGKCICGIGF